MPPAGLYHRQPGPAWRLSILYLRCDEEELDVAGADEDVISFNSLFEMQGVGVCVQRLHALCFQFSI